MGRERERIHSCLFYRERYLSKCLRSIAMKERARAVRKFCQLRDVGKRTSFVIQRHDRNEQEVGCHIQYVAQAPQA